MKYFPYLVFTLTRRESTFNEVVTTGPASTFKHHNQINRKIFKSKIFHGKETFNYHIYFADCNYSLQLIKLVPVFLNGPAPSEILISFFAIQPDSYVRNALAFSLSF